MIALASPTGVATSIRTRRVAARACAHDRRRIAAPSIRVCTRSRSSRTLGKFRRSARAAATLRWAHEASASRSHGAARSPSSAPARRGSAARAARRSSLPGAHRPPLALLVPNCAPFGSPARSSIGSKCASSCTSRSAPSRCDVCKNSITAPPLPSSFTRTRRAARSAAREDARCTCRRRGCGHDAASSLVRRGHGDTHSRSVATRARSTARPAREYGQTGKRSGSATSCCQADSGMPFDSSDRGLELATTLRRS